MSECILCENERMLAASVARIMSGRGLNWGNIEKFSVENYYEGGKCPHMEK